MTQTREYQRLNEAAIAHQQIVADQLFSMKGRPLDSLLRINPDAPTLREFRVLQDGSWVMLSTGASGNDFVSFLEYLTNLPRHEAADLLAGLVAAASPTFHRRAG